MGTKLMTIFGAVLVATLVYILYDTRLISSLAQQMNNNSVIRLETSMKFFSIDLSDEFERFSMHNPPSFDVLEALKRDGHSPVCVSVKCSTTRNYLDNSKSVKELHLESDIANIARKSNLSISARKPEIGGKQSEYLGDLGLQETQPFYKVPNVVHTIFLGTGLKFTFINYLSYRSVDRFIRPDQIFLHGDNIPKGKWWTRTINEVQNIYHVKRTYSDKAPNGQSYKFPSHISDYMRSEILLRYGGIYIDLDVLIVKSFNQLRKFSVVAGREYTNDICLGIMVAERGAPFLRLLAEQYHSYLGSQESWAEKAVYNVDKLARIYPHLVHVEETSLNRPSWREKAEIYDGWYNWKQNYAVHTWVRTWPDEKKPNGVEDILTKNTTFGEIARLALFGSHEISKQ